MVEVKSVTPLVIKPSLSASLLVILESFRFFSCLFGIESPARFERNFTEEVSGDGLQGFYSVIKNSLACRAKASSLLTLPAQCLWEMAIA
ncbi:MAG: hypothetical protein HY231_22280 [Acidobacteria bacterium]|nr:hypothetical protein [Acidobacteriota bacterium]